jgi:membrane protease YdiL (CAAX protease family)
MPIHPAAAFYVVFLVVIAPILSISSARRVGRSQLVPSRAMLARGALSSFAILGLLSWLVAWRVGIPWAVIHPLDLRGALLGLGLLVLLLAWAPIGWRMRSEREKRRTLAVAPETPAQALAWIGIALGAGVIEEIVWRGVLYACVVWLVKSPWIAIPACAIPFGLAHAIQGRRGMIVAGLIGAMMHGLVLLTGSLLPAMLAHFLYDAIVVFLLRAIGRRELLQAAA